ncbi:MAG: Acetyl-coenzyme A synthetase [Candidatus Methanolliviera sp. GoM_oil]|nr:MAG: Acetyl-coenzyme A synthetase [Candidatus Methanolliviera sp. GoM_oil]
MEKLKAHNPYAMMGDYDRAYSSFSFKDVEKNFDWSKTGKVNIAHEAVDRHVDTIGNHIALRYLNDEREEQYTFKDISILSNRFANLLKELDVVRGDRIFIFMPRSPELYIAFIGMLKVGAIPVPVFEAFMKDGLLDRMGDCDPVAVVTSDIVKSRIPKEEVKSLKHVIVTGQTSGNEISFNDIKGKSPDFEPAWLGLDDPLLIHYTSGSTGKPKGVLHAQRAMIGHYQTGKWILNFKEDDVHWCTADPGWVTGTSYGIFSPWLNGVGIVIRGGRFSPKLWYQTIEKLKVTVWYSAPTAFRLLMGAGDDLSKNFDLQSLRMIVSVGEPLNSEVIQWSLKAFNQPIHDSWWMTECGMMVISNYPTMPILPGSMGKPFPGVEATVIDDNGTILDPGKVGNLALKKGWPSMMKEIWKNEEKFRKYFKFDPWFISGDSAYIDEEGYFHFIGRVDDVINTSGERVGPFEVESRLIEHPAVIEAGVIGKPDPLRGEIIKAFVMLKDGANEGANLKRELMDFVKKGLAAHASPREIEFVKILPKTRSGKILRRVLKARELGLEVGDTSGMGDN